MAWDARWGWWTSVALSAGIPAILIARPDERKRARRGARPRASGRRPAARERGRRRVRDGRAVTRVPEEVPAHAAPLLEVERDARLERRRVDVERDRELLRPGGRLDTVDGLDLVDGGDRPGLHDALVADRLEVDGGRTTQAVDADDVLVLGGVAREVAEVRHVDAAPLDEHPAKLPVVGVDGGLLPRLPADDHDLEEPVLVDEVPGVAVRPEVEVGRERCVLDPELGAVLRDAVFRDDVGLEPLQAIDERVEVDRLLSLHGEPPKGNDVPAPPIVSSRGRPRAERPGSAWRASSGPSRDALAGEEEPQVPPLLRRDEHEEHRERDVAERQPVVGG